jgi:hypothetical protein
MTARFYLTVPFAQKDEAKALGARWDPASKRWYVPDGIDKSLFQRWHATDTDAPPAATEPQNAQHPSSSNRKQASAGVVIPSSNPDFVAYSGDAPPWE